MRFSFDKIQKKSVELVQLKDEKSGTTVTVIPSVGAALHEFAVQLNGSTFNVIDNYNDVAHAKTEMATSYKSAKLSPFVCRIPNGKYIFDNKEWEIAGKFLDGSAIHGLLFNKPFRITHEIADKEKAAVAMQYDYVNDDAGYPHQYTCRVEYTLTENNVLKLDTVITNRTNNTIPIADGWHPYFQLGRDVDDWRLSFDAQSMVEFDDKLIPTGRLLNYNLFRIPTPVGSNVFDNCFLLSKSNHNAACELFNPQNNLKLSFFPDNNYPYLQIYTPPHRKSIAIENLSSAPDSFNNRMGLLTLEPGHSKSFTVRYQLSWD